MDYLCSRLLAWCRGQDDGYSSIPSGSSQMSIPYSKLCAGLLLYHEGNVLMIRRNSTYNDKAWDFPGGQIDPADYPAHAPADIALGVGPDSGSWRGAMREATEELGSLPRSLRVVSALQLYRANNTKRYTLYIATIPSSAFASWRPRLSLEHDAWAWVPAAAVASLEATGAAAVHPWVCAFQDQHEGLWRRMCCYYRVLPVAPGDSWPQLKELLARAGVGNIPEMGKNPFRNE